jgi:hypothetical protein
MGRLRFIVGAVGIIVGFFVYQYGLFLTLNSELSVVGLGLSVWSEALVSWFGSSAVAGAIFQLIGGGVAIVGLLVCISWLGFRPKIVPIPSVAPTKSEPAPPISANVRQCKYCGAAMGQDAAFCPKCERAQA